jgi:hypothetical protein
MWPKEYEDLSVGIIKIYAIPLAIILTGIFPLPRKGLKLQSTTVAIIGSLLACLWNAILLAKSASFYSAASGDAGELLKNLNETSSNSSFLIAGMLTFFFKVEMRQT